MKRILIVDDHTSILEMLSQMLSSAGYQVDIAHDGDGCMQALTSHQSNPFEAVFLDILMPGMSGIEVLNRMKRSSELNGIPVIMLTGQDKPEQIIAGYQIGADYYMPKPFTLKQLTYALDLINGKVVEEDNSNSK